MKRNFIIAAIFSALFLVLLFTSCTCYMDDGSECRGCGYECQAFCMKCESCGMSCLDNLCPGFGIWEDYRDATQVSYIGKLGVDYKEPTVSFNGYNQVALSIEFLTADKESPWVVRTEILLFQGDTLVGKAETRMSVRETGMQEQYESCQLNDFYDPANGEVVCVVNGYSVTRVE